MNEESMINPMALKAARKRMNMTQEKLAEAVKCTKDTVSRWERGTNRNVRSRYRDSLCSALRVEWEQLSGTIEEKGAIPRHQPGRTKVTIDMNLRNSLQLVAERYSISLHDVINLAPLLLVIAAEKSLVWRRNRLVKIDSELTEMEEKLTHLSERLGETLAVRGTDIENSLFEEGESLKNRDVFGHSISGSNALWNRNDDPEDPHGPFIDFVREFMKDIPNEAVRWICSLNGKMVNDYMIASDTLNNSIGLSPDEEKDLEILYWIFREGTIDLRQCLRTRQERDESGYREWLSEQVRKANEGQRIIIA